MTTATIISKSVLTIPSFVKNMIEANTKGRFFSVVFVKKNGKQRKLVCRLGVKNYDKGTKVVGGPSNVAHIAKYLTAYDVDTGSYKNVNMETVQEIKFNGNHIIFK